MLVLFQLVKRSDSPVSPTPLAGPVSPYEAHLVCGAAMGAMAPARSLCRGRLGSRGADIGPDHLRRRVRVAVFARALFVRGYNATASSVLLVVIFHASFDGAINQLSYDVVPGSNIARFLIFTAVIVVFATAVIIANKGQLGRAKEAIETEAAVSDLDIWPEASIQIRTGLVLTDIEPGAVMPDGHQASAYDTDDRGVSDGDNVGTVASLGAVVESQGWSLDAMLVAVAGTGSAFGLW
jgi:hypothetical protein